MPIDAFHAKQIDAARQWIAAHRATCPAATPLWPHCTNGECPAQFPAVLGGVPPSELLKIFMDAGATVVGGVG